MSKRPIETSIATYHVTCRIVGTVPVETRPVARSLYRGTDANA